MAATPRDCPCFSGQRYTACCAPYHRGEREAPRAALLMRSRFAAFALGLGPYLVRTFASEHPDLALPHDALARELGRVRERQRFLGLRILHEPDDADPADGAATEAEVLFFAKIFAKGTDRSFAELSRFTREAEAWRYASGVLVPRQALPADLATLTPEDVRRTAL